MFLNDAKGSYGMFSSSGKNSLLQYHVITKQEDILSGRKNLWTKGDHFAGDDQTKHVERVDDHIDIFKSDGKEAIANGRISLLTSQRQGSFGMKFPLGEIRGNKKLQRRRPSKFHDKHTKAREKQKKNDEPTCTKYNPQWQVLRPKASFGLQWEKITGRISSPPRMDEADFYLNHKDFLIKGKNSINMAKQTQRQEFPGSKDIKTRNVKSAGLSSQRMKLGPKKTESLKSKAHDSEAITNREEEEDEVQDKSISLEHEKEFVSGCTYPVEDEDSLSILFPQKKKLAYPRERETKSRPATSTKTNRYVKVQAIDFKKVISRDQLDAIYGDKRTIIPFSIPNFTVTHERPIMMVKYDKLVHNKKKKNQRKKYCEASSNYDPHRVLDRVNNYKRPISPNFKLMTSRPNDGDPLPAYMKQIHSRGGAELVTEKTLKMNNYAEGKFIRSQTSFWPKKTFNKIINLNLLNSEKFLTNVGYQVGEDTNSNTANQYVSKSMKFYNKNFDDLMKESMLSKFDNVTYKTIKRENKLDTADVEKFLLHAHNKNESEI